MRLDLLREFTKQYQTLAEIREKDDWFESRVSKYQWATRYLISAQGVSCDIFENEFNLEMYF